MQVYDINDSGQFVGWAQFEVPINKKRSTHETRAILYDGNSLVDLVGGGSLANGINSNGDVVGSLAGENTSNITDGFVYLEECEQVVNLDDAVIGDDVDLLLWFDVNSREFPQRINDAGQIAGYVSNSDLIVPGVISGTVGFVLTPVP